MLVLPRVVLLIRITTGCGLGESKDTEKRCMVNLNPNPLLNIVLYSRAVEGTARRGYNEA